MKESPIWVHCPICSGRTYVKVYKDSILLNVPLYCPVCERETRVNIVQLQLVLVDEMESIPD